ncbi:sodium:calcium antiporter [Wenxinia saemankumensis]|uniref:Cation:H+ antiporter n=1 Tax=Wenxinia saemankumensis TaxID=1447782 RepID=A0A1M5ZY57_9RHOB|nr:hypothetical protein [Wenxinia saemankumensis]SHI29217.1 cation:H+ antiporter [Wenxinia saemankumensis]
MSGLFEGLPLALNIAIFLVAAVFVWGAGTRLSAYADAIARRTGIGEATLGVLLLGGATSLPEIAVAGSAAITGNAALAANNLLGGFTMQVAILAVADAVHRRGALTTAVPDPVVLLQGALGVVLMCLIIAGIASGDIAFLGAGVWTWIVFVTFLYSLRLVTQAQGSLDWKVVGQPPGEQVGETEALSLSDRALWLRTAAVAGVILVAGVALSSTGEALAEQTGLGASFFGAVFVAIATSLPEVSTVLAAMKRGRYVMAVSDIFGTNLFDIALIFVLDLFYAGPPILSELDSFSILAATLGTLVTALYLVGLIERRDPTVAKIGLDSVIVAVVYLGGLGVLYTLR